MMNMNSKTTAKALAISSLMAMGVTACSNNPYKADSMDHGYSNSEQMKKSDASCGEGKCGGDMKKSDHSCGGDMGKHGEGSCGGDMNKHSEGSCGGDMKKGDHSCGGNM